MSKSMQTPPPLSSSPAPAPLPTKLIQVKDLLGAAQEVQLQHEGQVYRLRVTKARKLILTK
jgi:hemin uptake protein HemP